jgi:predicted nucleic acid-binding protein
MGSTGNMTILLDASAVMDVILNEPNRDLVIKLTNNALLVSPEVMPFEIGNALVNLYKRQKLSTEKVLEAFGNFTLMPLKLIKVHIEKALQTACTYNIYSYDAY